MAGETPTETSLAAVSPAAATPAATMPAAPPAADAVVPLADDQLDGVSGGANIGNRNTDSPF
ncbi:hypothetical protein GCM10007301_52950 [Azorhizobium oxalatiphilum]|uniref:Uncharacterized protein n=1 Tax=Azorhizobium oxalatiphilum TaxID=980631 RepID=A0A917CF29_9HYPH|nr:hypothetical protein [Azorhizobium oxalatiphilum]GGF86480.1 hypothetical protein GCM10007301_52950 [Azorhizobium oxalatiphilum]